MTRLNSVEIGGRDSRTTSSTAWRNEEPARRPLASSVIVSGSCLLNAPRRPALRRFSQKRGSKNPRNAPTSSASGLRSAGSAERHDDEQERDADDRADPDREELGRLELQVGPGDVAGEVRPEVALLDDLVELGEGDALGEQVGDAALRRVASVLPLWRAEAYRSRRALTPELLPDVAMPIAIRKIAAAATAATTRVMAFTVGLLPAQ